MACACYVAVFRDVFGFIRDGLAISCQDVNFREIQNMKRRGDFEEDRVSVSSGRSLGVLR